MRRTAMTGGEIVAGKAVIAAGKAAKGLADEALGSDDDEARQLLQLSKDNPAMQAAADSYARRVAVKQQLLLKLYQPLARLLGISRDYFDDGFARDLAAETVDIPDENLVSPPGNIALPAMQGLAFSLDEPDLKAMYLKLLAAASDDRRPYDAHPSFAQIIKELSSEEAKLLLSIIAENLWPVVRIKVRLPLGGWHHIWHNLLHWTDPEDLPDAVDGQDLPDARLARCAYVDNWIRLGLVEVSYSEILIAGAPGFVDPYEWVTTQAEYLTALAPPEPTEDNPNPQLPVLEIDKGSLRVTDFGKRFYRAIS